MPAILVATLLTGGTAAGALPAEQPTAKTQVALSIAIEPYGTYGPGAHDAVAQAVISCTRATPVLVLGAVTQQQVTGIQLFATQTKAHRCRPDAPLRAFIPARLVLGVGSFGAGTANVDLLAIATRAPFGFATASRDVTLIDQVALEKFIIGEVLKGDTALDATVQEHIAIRSWQDPAFVQEQQ